MDNKNIKILAAVFLAMAIILILPWIGNQFGIGKDKDGPKNISLDFSDFSEKSVEKVVIQNGETKKELSFREGKWLIDGGEADGEKVTGFFSELKKLKVGEMVSQSEANQSKFGVDREAAIKLSITQNGKEAIFLVGKIGATPNQFYMRKDGIKNTYLVESALREKLLWDAVKWQKAAENSSSAPSASSI
ncbi:MAG: DUF4340 domain-containing protein [Candidatus Moraniibacteriota bacterium]